MERTSMSATYPVEFSGTTSEYFRIWIVNLGLSIITLGVYSAWAKIRKLKYLYGHTRLAGAAFDYSGDPLGILKGRAIAVAGIASYLVSARLYPETALIYFLLAIPALPWLIVQTARFKARNTIYRGLRFNFCGRYGQALKPYGLYYLALPFTFGLAYPVVFANQRRFVYNHLQYGRSPFSLYIADDQVYVVFMQAIMLAALAFLSIPLLGNFLSGFSLSTTTQFFAFGLMMLLPLTVMRTVYQEGFGNLIWNNLSIGPHRFISELDFIRLLTINLTNGIAIVFSLGLLTPWATLRSLRYRLSCLTVVGADDLNEFVNAETEAVKANGEEIAEFLDIDMGL